MDWTKQFGLSDREAGEYNEGPRKEEVVESLNAYEADGYEKFRLKVHSLVKEVFRAAALYKPEIHNPNCRALYGIDILPTSKLEPYILEVTFMPELTHVCKVQEKYLSQINRCMFLGESDGMTRLY
mmetsp:Transcript_38214/g.37715  ORF Transcript_38214/g.37715 Transcript_38214/m.37715 type:complete len:126 (-) Transcript_38214:26-403(-)